MKEIFRNAMVNASEILICAIERRLDQYRHTTRSNNIEHKYSIYIHAQMPAQTPRGTRCVTVSMPLDIFPNDSPSNTYVKFFCCMLTR